MLIAGNWDTDDTAAACAMVVKLNAALNRLHGINQNQEKALNAALAEVEELKAKLKAMEDANVQPGN